MLKDINFKYFKVDIIFLLMAYGFNIQKLAKDLILSNYFNYK